MRLSLLVVLALLAAACSDDAQIPIESEPDIEVATDAELLEARQEALAMIDPVGLPDFATEAPITGRCRDTLCETTRALFEARDWPKAWQGDYEAQRNVAFCLGNGCDGAVLIDQTSSCAWRGALIEMNKLEATDMDAASLEQECGVLSEVQKRIAIAKAQDIVSRIQGP